jgi:hypothetical protein
VTLYISGWTVSDAAVRGSLPSRSTVGMAEHKVTSHFMSHKGIGATISAEHAVGIRIEVCHFKNWQVSNSGESRPIACADNFCHCLPVASAQAVIKPNVSFDKLFPWWGVDGAAKR